MSSDNQYNNQFYPVAVDGNTNEILSGEMSLEERIKFGYKYAKNHPKYSDNYQTHKLKINKHVSHPIYSSDSELESEEISQSDSDDYNTDSNDSTNSNNSKKSVKSKIHNVSKRIRSLHIPKHKPKKEKMSKKQINILKQICNIYTIKKHLDEICISSDDFSKDNVTLILTVIDSIVSNNSLTKEENKKIKKLLNEINN